MTAGKNKILGLLGMAQRAGRVASGSVAAEKAICGGKASYIIMATDIAEETKKKYEALASRYNVAFSCLLTKEELGYQLGKGARAAAVITDAGFGQAIRRLLEEKATL